MIGFGSRFLKNLAGMADDNGIGGDDDGGLAEGRVVEFGGVYVHCFLFGGLEDVFQGGEGFGEVFGEGGGEDFEVVETNLGESRLKN